MDALRAIDKQDATDSRRYHRIVRRRRIFGRDRDRDRGESGSGQPLQVSRSVDLNGLSLFMSTAVISLCLWLAAVMLEAEG